MFLFHKVEKPMQQADLQSSTCYQSFNILWINFQSLVVLIHGFHMAPNLKIINPSLHTGEKYLEKYYVKSGYADFVLLISHKLWFQSTDW